MTLLAYLAGDDHAHNVRLNDLGLTTHADGSVGFGGIVFDDPDGTLLVRGWMEVIVVEDECIDAPILFRGWVGNRTYSRQAGQGLAYQQGTGRYIDTNLVDPNDGLAIRLITEPDWKRDPETDIQRIDALLASAYLSGLVSDLGLIWRGHPRPFQDADYRGEYPKDVLDDVAAPINRMYFVYINQPDGEFGLFYDAMDSTVNTSGLSISNVMADESDTCFYPSKDATLGRDPSAVVAKERVVYRNGLIIENNVDTYNTFFSAAATGGADLGLRGDEVDNDRIGLESTARLFADGNLAKNGVERDTITCSIILPPEQVGLIDCGMRVAVKFSHLELEGYGGSDFVYVRCQARTIQQFVTNRNYLVTLELSNNALRSNGGGGSPGGFPQPPTGPLTIIQQSVGLSDRTMPAPVADGDVLVIVASKRTSAVVFSPPGYTDSGEGDVTGGVDYVKGGYRTASSDSGTFGGSSVNEADGWYEISPGATLVDHASDTGSGYIATTPDVIVPAGGILFTSAGIGSGGGFDHGDYNGPPTRPGPNLAWTNPAGWVIDWNAQVFDGHPSTYIGYYQNATTSPVTVSPSLSFYNDGAGPWPWQMVVMVFGPTAGANPPQPGQDVPWEVVTMTTVNGVSTGTTQFPYADRSLLVKVDGVLISTASYVEDDGLCGDFHLTWEKDPSEVVTVKYIGR